MACHLAHRLPWGRLLEIYVNRKTQGGSWRASCPPKVVRFLKHFVRCFIQQLHEFRETDKSTDEEIRAIDPKGWGDYEYTMGGWMGYYDSLVWGYLELNLLLMDPRGVAPLMMSDGKLSWPLRVLTACCDGAHPDHIAGPLREALKDGEHRDFSSPALMKTMREHAALMFRCMFSITGRNTLLESETTEMLVFWLLGWQVRAIHE